MARMTTEARLDALAAEGGFDEAVVRRGLKSRRWVVVMKAAQRVHDPPSRALEADLAEAFGRLLEAEPKADAGCHAKLAIMRAFERGDCLLPEVFLRGLRHTQWEPVWGGREDTAGPLRAVSAACLVRTRDPRVLDELAILLADHLPEPRRQAAALIPAAGVPGGAALLKLKLLHGDTHPEVLSACCASLLALDGEDGLGFVERLLFGEALEAAEAAATGLGESRLPSAAPLLDRAWGHRVEPGWRRHVFTCMVLLRLETAHARLVALLVGEDDAVAADVAAALAPVVAHDPRLRGRAREALGAVPSRARRHLVLELLGEA